MTRSSATWQARPGSFDTVNVSRGVFPAANAWGIPDLMRSVGPLPRWAAPYGQRIRRTDMDGGMLHFFLDDYRFEAVWSRPQQTLSGIRRWGTVVTPDFSLYRDDPLAVQLWNTYRNRWLGAYWQRAGIHVVPTISWSTEPSYAFCFAGVPQGSTVAIGAPQRGDALTRQWYQRGFQAMVAALAPACILCYGRPSQAMLDVTPQIMAFPTLWDARRPTVAVAQERVSLPATEQLAFASLIEEDR